MKHLYAVFICNFAIVLILAASEDLRKSKFTISKVKGSVKKALPTLKFNIVKNATLPHNSKLDSRQNVISNRDSYVDAAHAVGVGGHQQFTTEGQNTNFQSSAINSYQVPQVSYSGSYPTSYKGHVYQQQQGGYYGNSKTSGKSGDGGVTGVGLLGLLGLFGLLGVIPLIKIIILAIITFLPALVPLGILKLPLLLLTPIPIVSLGRHVHTGGLLRHVFHVAPERIMENLDKLDEYIWNSLATENSTQNDSSRLDALLSDSKTNKGTIENDDTGSLRRSEDNRCMERIACEGVFKSIPRIVLRFLGRNSYLFMSTPKRHANHGRSVKEDESKEIDEEENDFPEMSFRSRRKDLATLALEKLKHNQYLVKQQPLTQDPINAEEVCRQYTCSTFF